ncbi:unnamed protein product, partial [Mesorhabditis belari]|uniref:Beta-lactamase-related domain-containing protein n=1 Tax=Mesorhabditis belari TaxID=2138241 RepID=A0AAF3EEA1_9BILA
MPLSGASFARQLGDETIFLRTGSKNLPVIDVNGTFDRKYELVAEDFRKLLQEQSQGLTLAVLHKGELVINLWGGKADVVAGRNWTENTMSVAYSATKLIGALAFATLASRKQVDYNDKVTKYWPEFGKHEKDVLTIDDILNHKSGLIKFSRDFTLNEAKDERFMSKLIEESVPMWAPGERIGYHALTYGFLLDQLFQRIHPKKQTIQEFYEKEIRSKVPNGDFYLGVRKEEAHRIARITLDSLWQTMKNHWDHFAVTWPVFYAYFKNGGLALVSGNSPSFLSVSRRDIIPYNDIDVLQFPSTSALGVGTAAGFTRVVRQFWIGGVISEEIWRDLEKPAIFDEEDFVLGLRRWMKHGLFYRKIEKADRFTINFPGNGGQYVDVDQKRDLIIVLMRNGLRGGLGDPAFDGIRRKIIEIADED